ncbi:LTA synthase family protein [Alkalihalobacillus sp. MEB130]|uniref:LTA synthase family protein n=1 Tax=Alkalihalobacillus sp. MEB130 TaxID=2976704 RepID=UPI0028DEB6E1|nr:LTA synthase family protein [Alkalihalobacillus sp. MEB130]MDT8862037.1 LTA synthase family protein [Alkalihalobacillus sp. MEB130]
MAAKIKAELIRLRFLLLAVAFLCLKTYLLYKFGFHIQSENILQEMLLLLNPLSASVFVIGLSLFFSGVVRNGMVIVLSTIATCILYFNLLYYRFFTDFLTWPVLFQTSNAKDLQGSFLQLMNWTDAFLLFDILILIGLIWWKKIPLQMREKREPAALIVASLVIFLFNIGIAQIERPQLLTRAFDREMLVKNIGLLNYHVYDAYVQSHSKAQRVFAESSDIDEVIRYRKENYKEPNPEMYGIAEGKNVIVLSLESLQSFVINETLNGEEITPFLNDLIEESYYFDHFYHQTAQGKTSDSEFLVANSLFGRDSGSVFFTHAGNEYNSLPEWLHENGYYSSVMHANNKSFWNRDMMYLQFGYDQFFDIDSFTVTEENSIGWGLKDVDFFEQSIDLLKTQPKPFYTKLITLTNHYPFELGEEDKMINEFDSNSGTLNRYFPTVRYMDHAVEEFFTKLKEEGLYEDSIFILYGDHYGISEYHHKAMSQFLGKEELTPFDHVQLQRVPLLIHIPGHDPSVNHTVSGQIDLKPTIMHLLGIDTRDDIQFGSDLFSNERESFAVLRNTSFITDDIVFTNGVCYDKGTGEETLEEKCEPFMEKAQLDLRLSDKIIYGDLLRFD